MGKTKKEKQKNLKTNNHESIPKRSAFLLRGKGIDMGGRGASSISKGGGSIATSNKIKQEILDKALNSRFKGVQRDAREGKGVYGFKDAKAVSSSDALKMKVDKVLERDGNTLIEGFHKGKHVFYAGKDSDGTIKKIKNKQAERKAAHAKEQNAINRPEIRTTTTYDGWRKQNAKNFDAWFGDR